MNFIEKNLPKSIRENMRTLIATALGLFLALQYNEAIKAIFETLLPLDSSSIWARIVYVIILTFVIVGAIYLVEKGLDGK